MVPKEDGEFLTTGLIGDDIVSIQPDAVYSDKDGYLRIDIPVLSAKNQQVANAFSESPNTLK